MSIESEGPRFRPARRQILVGGALSLGSVSLLGGRLHASLASLASLAGTPGTRGDDGKRVLVVIQLAGGNDGLNTVVPYADDLYHSARPTLRVPADAVRRIDDYRGFHPRLAELSRLYDSGLLAIVEGAGYPSPNRSHFASFDIWHAASERGRSEGSGWLTRLAGAIRTDLDQAALAVHVGDLLPFSLFSPTNPSVCFSDPQLYQWDRHGEAIAGAAKPTGAGGVLRRLRSTYQQAETSSASIRRAADAYRPAVEYPDTELGAALRTVAAILQGGVGSRILSVELGGFDHHVLQKAKHEELLSTLDGALGAFLADLDGTPAALRTAVLVFSEFGRRVAENGGAGTDHGTAGQMLVAGAGVRGGLYGAHPSLADLDDGDLFHTVDFRSVYATLVQDWFGADPREVLGADYPILPIFAG